MLSCFSQVQLFVTLGTAAHQAPQPTAFSRQEYWSGLPFSSPGDLPNPGIEPGSPALEADTLTSEPPGTKDQTRVPCIERWILNYWTTREVPLSLNFKVY